MVCPRDGLPWASEARLLNWSWHCWFFLPHLLVLNRHISHHLLYLRYFPFILHSCSCFLCSCPFILLARLSILMIQGLACLVQCFLQGNTSILYHRYRLPHLPVHIGYILVGFKTFTFMMAIVEFTGALYVAPTAIVLQPSRTASATAFNVSSRRPSREWFLLRGRSRPSPGLSKRRHVRTQATCKQDNQNKGNTNVWLHIGYPLATHKPWYRFLCLWYTSTLGWGKDTDFRKRSTINAWCSRSGR